MKKLLSTAAALLCIASFTFAQAPAKKTNPGQAKGQQAARPGQGQGRLTPEQRADTVAKRMTKQLGLTPDQTTKVRAATLNRAQRMDSARAAYANNPQERAKKCQAIRTQYDTDLKGILTADQYAKYEARKQEKMRKAQQARAQKQGANANAGKTPEQIQDEVETEMEGELGK